MNICVYGAASNLIDSSFIKAGELLGEKIAECGHGVVYGGGGEGMMGAVARGAHSKNGKIIGIAPSFFKVDGVLFDNCTEFIYPETMRERKRLLEEMSEGFIVTPGGLGTYDELFEILSLRQLRRHTKPIVIYNINGYYNPIIEMLKSTAEQNFMKSANLSIFHVADTPEDAISYIENYHADNKNITDFR